MLSGRADPDCALGHLLKTLFRNDDFMDKLVNSYIMSTMEEFDLNCIAARVLLNAMPGLESAAVFQDMVSKLNKTNKRGYDIINGKFYSSLDNNFNNIETPTYINFLVFLLDA